jgi:acylphosphatase
MSLDNHQAGSVEQARLHARVTGMVQGVGFRMFVHDYAAAYGLTGWVRNTYNGDVEVTAEGSYAQLERLVEKLRMGPRSAFVEELQKEWLPPTGEFSTFEVRRTE